MITVILLRILILLLIEESKSLSDKINFLYFNKYKNDFFIVDNENMVRRVKFEIKQKNKNKDKDKDKNDKNKKKVGIQKKEI